MSIFYSVVILEDDAHSQLLHEVQLYQVLPKSQQTFQYRFGKNITTRILSSKKSIA